MEVMKVYYAHCQAIYGGPQEKRDIETLQALGFTVISPSDPVHQDWAKNAKAQGMNSSLVMNYFFKLVAECDAFAFRSLPDGTIPAGVANEMATAITNKKPIFELPSLALRRTLTVDETRAYFKEVGQR
jgi:hypothetical protein